MDHSDSQKPHNLHPGETAENRHQFAKREVHDCDINLKQKNRHLLKVLSYNVWNTVEYWEERITQVLKLVKDNSPDVCCLLEVTKECHQYILDALEKLYIIFQVFIEEGDQSGMVLLCKRETVDLPLGSEPYYYDFKDRSGRVIGVELVVLSNSEKIHVLCTKLDDHPDNEHIRSEQFDVLDHIIKKIRNCIVVGDFNIFLSGEETVEHKILRSKLNDCWIKMGCPGRVKYTFDGIKNKLTKDRSQMRASRIYYVGSRLTIKSLSFIGTNHISTNLPIAPSCHYGIIGIFQCGKQSDY